MDFKTLFSNEGQGIIATSSADGVVDLAIYARPHVMDDDTLAWGTAEKRTYANLLQNPHAAYLFQASGASGGVRLTLKLKRIEDAGEMLESIKAHTAEIVTPQAAEMVKHVAYFEVTEIRPLI